MFGEDGRNLSSRNTVLKFTLSPSFIGSCLKKNSVRTETNRLDHLFDLTCTRRIFVNDCGLNLRNFAQLGNYFHLPPVCDERKRKMVDLNFESFV